MANLIDLTVMLDHRNDRPMYVQLYEEIKRQIEEKVLSQGVILPSIRQLAEYLKISKNTVDHAYQQLVAEGYIESRPRSGYSVLPLEAPLVSKNQKLPLPEKLQANLDTVPRYDFKYGEIESPQYPMKHWRKCLSDVLDKETSGILGYGHPQGESALRVEIAKYLLQSRGVSCDPEQILICAGTQHAVSMLVRLFNWGSRMIAMEDPGYRGVRTVFADHGCRIQPISVEADGMNVRELEGLDSNIGAVYVTPSHQFPLGMVMPIQKRRRLLQWAEQHEAIVIEDDYDSEFRYMGQPIPSLKSLDQTERVVYMGTFSKAFLPSARLSYIVLPSRMLPFLRNMLDVYNQAVSPIIQHAVTLFMQRGHFLRHIRKMRRLYQAKHRALVSAIEREMGKAVRIIEHNSGLHLLIDVKGKNNEELLKLATKVGVKVYRPSPHWLDPAACPRSYVMLGFGGLSITEIEVGIEKLKEAWFR